MPPFKELEDSRKGSFRALSPEPLNKQSAPGKSGSVKIRKKLRTKHRSSDSYAKIHGKKKCNVETGKRRGVRNSMC